LLHAFPSSHNSQNIIAEAEEIDDPLTRASIDRWARHYGNKKTGRPVALEMNQFPGQFAWMRCF
jgi:hypothetical protein